MATLHSNTSENRATPGLILMLGCMTAFGALAIDMYLPAIPTIARDFGTRSGAVQPTIATYLLGLSLGQLFWGAVSDRLGRRLPLLIGISLFVVASAGCALAGSLDVLLLARFGQGLGACAGQVMARALVADRFHGRQAAVIFSWQQLVMGVGPMISPVIGGFILGAAGWRLIFWLMAALGLILVVVATARLQESQSAEQAAHARRESRIAAYLRLLGQRRIVGHLLVGGFATSALMTWLSGASPLLQDDYGWSPRTTSWLFMVSGIAVIGMTQVNRRLLARFTSRQILGRAIAGAATLVALALMLDLLGAGARALTLTAAIAGVGMHGFVGANNQALALSIDRMRAGSLSALLGGTSFGCGAIMAWLVSRFPTMGGIPMLAIMLGNLCLSLLVLHLLVGPERDLTPTPA